MDKMLATEDVMKILQVCRRTVWRHVKAGRLKADTSMAKDFRFKMSDVQAFIDGEFPGAGRPKSKSPSPATTPAPVPVPVAPADADAKRLRDEAIMQEMLGEDAQDDQ